MKHLGDITKINGHDVPLTEIIVGGSPLVYSRCGVKPVWASEIEEFPIAVTKIRFPEGQDNVNSNYGTENKIETFESRIEELEDKLDRVSIYW